MFNKGNILFNDFKRLLFQGHAIIGRGRSLDGRGHGEDSTEPRGRSLQAGNDKAGKRSHVSVDSPETTIKKNTRRNVNETLRISASSRAPWRSFAVT